MKLVYFNARGLAETSRLLLALAQVDYVDFRYDIEVIDPENHIYKHDEFDLDKASGKLDKSNGKLPYLELDDGTIISQSKSIERYIAKHYGMMGHNHDIREDARIDSVCEYIRDIKEKYVSDPKEYFSKNLHNDLMGLLNLFDKDTPFSIGHKLSLADVSIYSLITQYFENKDALAIAGKIPRIRDIILKVASRPEIRVWILDRPKTSF
jgi:prostaglandin-H2 D-isomerase / glutathione transferase